jgi:hypothetical protein
LEIAIEHGQHCRSCVYFALFRDNVDRADFQSSNCLLAEDYRCEAATLSKQVANLTQANGESTPAYLFVFFHPSSRTPLWSGGSVAAVSALHSRLAGAQQGSITERVSPFPLERSSSRPNSPWKSKTVSSGNRGLLGDVEPEPDTKPKQLCCPGSRGSSAFFLGGFPFKIGSGGYLCLRPVFCLPLLWLLPRVQILGAPTLIRP